MFLLYAVYFSLHASAESKDDDWSFKKLPTGGYLCWCDDIVNYSSQGVCRMLSPTSSWPQIHWRPPKNSCLPVSRKPLREVPLQGEQRAEFHTK